MPRYRSSISHCLIERTTRYNSAKAKRMTNYIMNSLKNNLFMKRLYTLLALFCCFSIAVQAQSKSGTFGLHVEAGYAFIFSEATRPKAIDGQLDKAWSIAVSPGYHVTDKLFAGVGVGLYNYGFNYNELSEGMLDLQSNFLSIPIYAQIQE